MGFFDAYKKKKLLSALKSDIEITLGTHIKSIMTKYVISVHPDEKLIDAANIIVGEKVSCVVVKDEEEPIAVLTERDFLKKAPLNQDEFETLLVKDLMSSSLITVESKTNVFDAVKILSKNNFRKLVIKDINLQGIVTQTDFIKLMDQFYDKLTIKTSDLTTIQDVMTKNVLTINYGEKFKKAKEMMAQKGVGSIVVMKNNEVAGITTEYNVVAELVKDAGRINTLKVEETMSSPVIGIKPETNIFDANRIMIKENIRRLPVMNGNKMVGIITQTDLCRDVLFLENDFMAFRKK